MRTFQKRFLSLAFVGSAIAMFSATPLLGQDITTGLVGHWTFDDQTLDESSGFQDDGVHDGIAVGTIAYTDDTPAGGFALDMTASGTELAPIDSYVQVLNSNIIVGGSPGAGEGEIANETYQPTFDPPELGNGFSIAFWGRGTPTRWQAFVSKNGESNFGYQVRRRASELRTTFTLRSTDGADDPEFVDAETLNVDPAVEDEWHHYTATWTAGEDGFRNFYIDGDLVHTEIDWIEGQVNGDGNPIAPDNAYGSSRNEFLVFGGRDSLGVIGDGGALCMDDIRIYNRPIDAAAAAVLATPFGDIDDVLLGDINRDGLVNFLDISPFIGVLAAQGNQAEADLNEDGVVSFSDISPFIIALTTAST